MLLTMRAVRSVVEEQLGARHSRNDVPKRGAASRWLRWWMSLVFAVAAFEQVNFSGPINSTVLLQRQLWAKSTALYERINDLSRAPPPDVAATVRVISPVSHDAGGVNAKWAVVERFNGSTPGVLSLGRGDGQKSVSTGSSSGTPAGVSLARGDGQSSVSTGSSSGTPAGVSEAGSGSPSSKKRKKAGMRCTVCGDLFNGMLGFGDHLGRSSWCAEADAQCEVYDADAERERRTTQRTGDDIYATDVHSQLLEGYSALQYDRLVDTTAIQQGVKEDIVEPLVAKMKAEIYKRLASNPAEHQKLEDVIGTVFQVHRGLETTAKQETALMELVEPVAPVRRELVDKPDTNGGATGPRRGDFMYDIPISKELEAMVKANSGVLDQLRTASNAWAETGPQPGSSTKVYADISDGAVMQKHSQLGASADRSDGSVRLAFILYYDDLEVVNPLGAFHGTHKLGMFYWGLVNINAEERMAFHNLHLASIALVHDIDYYGISQVVSGLPGDTSFGSSMTALDRGISIAGQLVRGWLVVVSADYPAAGLLAGFKKSVSATLFCRECDCDQSDEAYPCPNSFVESNSDLEQEHLLREDEEYQAQLAHYLTLQTATERAAYLASIGVFTFEAHAFTRIPLFDLCTMIPYDFMHVELEGSLKNELAAMIFYFLRKRPEWGFTLSKLNERIQEYAWPAGARIATFTEGYLNKGTKEGQCKRGCHVHMTSGDVMMFVRHSVDLLLPLIGDTSDQLWQCWLVHVRYVRLLMKHRLTADDILELDRLIYQHHQLFLEECEDEYGARLFKPKNHFASHFPSDILNFGPVRGYWCMRFEALNQLFKNFAKSSSFRDVCKRCAEYWALHSARLRDSSRLSTWGATRSVHSSLPQTYRRSSPSASDPPAIALIFSLIASAAISVEWIRTLYHAGNEYNQNASWLTATFNGERILGFIPNRGIFKFNGRFYIVLHLYPHSSDAEFGLPTSTYDASHEPRRKLMALDSGQLKELELLWPSYRTVENGEVKLRFVPL